MDVTSKSFDLVRAFAETTVNGNSVTSAATELARWLLRERIAQSEFDYFLTQTCGLAYPNDNGLRIEKSLQDATHKLKLGSLNLKRSGAIGRMLASDLNYRYMVTTVSTVMVHHNMAFATELLCHMAVNSFQDDQGDGVRYPHHIRRRRILPVAEKFVGSINLNVTNCGHDLRQELPSEFDDACLHCLNHKELAACIMAIQSTETDLLVLVEHFYVDLFLWLQNHWHGAILVTLAGKLIYETILGPESRRMSIIVKSLCSTSGPTHAYSVSGEVQIATLVKGVQETLLQVSTKPVRPNACMRLPLYCAESINKGQLSLIMLGWDQGLLNKYQVTDICVITQQIFNWLLGVALRPQTNYLGNMAFRTIFDRAETSDISIGYLLRRRPAITHMQFGKAPDAYVVFTGSPEIITGTDEEYDQICIECFPALSVFLDKMAKECKCEDCLDSKPVGSGKHGCLRETAFIAFSTLLGHAIADGFGADDVSGITDARVLAKVVQYLLRELVLHEKAEWNQWFRVATTVYLGCSGESIRFVQNAEDAGLIVGVQYGSLVALASWIDLEIEQQKRGCFGFNLAEGRLSSIDGVASEFAVVRTERTLGIADDIANIPSSLFPQTSNQDLFDLRNANDDCQTLIQVALMAQQESTYQLLTMVRSGKYLRIIDPSQVLWGLLKALDFECNCKVKHHAPIERVPSNVSIWSFEEVLGGFDAHFRPKIPAAGEEAAYEPEVTVCNTFLKFNVAMALSSGGFLVVDPEKSCLNGAIEHVESQKWEGAFDSKRILVRKIDNNKLALYSR